MTPGVVADKLQVRNQYNKYIRPVGDGRYELIRRGRGRREESSGQA
ncbi:hypothetical protein QO001_003894 [Methylobacterium brachiatum]|uniref:Uncharacterized protein n=1 Tax=Methylobacterium brachiatum TaxID=269660 RepID=A0AAJ1TW87_9HYPH|nr:hypothetical protein [Methylobacterium brachiatum]